MKKKGVYSKEKEGLGGGRWEIIKKVRENIILILPPSLFFVLYSILRCLKILSCF